MIYSTTTFLKKDNKYGHHSEWGQIKAGIQQRLLKIDQSL